MRIAVLVRTFDVGGAERHLITLTRGLRQRGHDALVVVVEGGGTLVPELHAAGVGVYEATDDGVRSLPARMPRLLTMLRSWRPDVLHGCLAFGNVLSVMCKPFLPGTRITLAVQVLEPERDPRRLDVRALYTAETAAARVADAVVSNSEAGRTYVIGRGFPASRVHVIPNGIDTDRYRPDPEARAHLRSEWGVADDEVLVGRVGRLRPTKDYPTFLRAATAAGHRDPRLRFVCVGDGPLREELQALGNELDLDGRLLWAGERTDMPAVMNALDVMVSSSVTESAPNVLGEAMACGVPCAVTDAGDSGVIVGDTGAVAPPGEPGALADRVLQLTARLEEEGPELRARARARVEDNFTIDSMVEQHEQLFRDLVTGNTPR